MYVGNPTKSKKMKQYIPALAQSPLFRYIKPQEIEMLLGCLRPKIRHFNKNDNVLVEGKALDRFGILLSGKLQIVQYDYFGNRTILSSLHPVQLFAEAFAYVDAKFPLTVEVCEKSTVLFLDSTKCARTCQRRCLFHTEIAYNLLHILARKNVNLTQKIECMSQRTTREKLLTFLSLQALAKGSNEFEIPYNRQELADYLGVDRSAMAAEISKLRKEGKLESKKNKFKLLKGRSSLEI